MGNASNVACCNSKSNNSTIHSVYKTPGDSKKKSFNDQYQNYQKFQRSEQQQKDADPNDNEYFGTTHDPNAQSTVMETENYNKQDSQALETPDVVRRIVKENIRSVYKMGKIIGSGNFGTVRFAAPFSNPNKVFAIKSIPRDKIEQDLQMLEQELLIMLEVDHPNIIKFYETYRDKKYYHIVMEYCEGGELFEHLINIGKFSEADAAKIIKQILSAIKHLHDKNIAHRDLKPENVIFVSKDSEIQIKLIDFGLSKLLGLDQKHMMTKLGTPYYVSPEVLEGTYDKRCDLWAIGVMAYILLSGSPPFNGRNEVEVFNKIRCCDYEFPDDQWSYISKEAKDFIFKLLQPNPNRRATPEQALAHQWLKTAPGDVEICQDVLLRLSKFQQPKTLQQQLLLLLVNQLDDDDLKKNKETFRAIDEDHSGLISVDELKKAFKNIDTNNLSDEAIESIIKRVDYDNNGEINYSEFLSGTIDEIHLNETNLYQLFKFLDALNQGYLTKESLTKTFNRAGKDISEEQIITMLGEINIDPDQQINFAEFVKLIKNIST